MNLKSSTLIMPTVVIATLLLTSFQSFAMAGPEEHCGQMQMSHQQMKPEQADPEKMREHMKNRLGKLAERLEIKASQQAAWGEFAKSVELLAERNMKRPSDDADAATISRYQADRAAEFANKLNSIANAIAKLQTALSDDQRKILNQVSHRLLNMKHDHRDKGMGRHGNPDMEDHHGGHHMAPQ